MNYYLQSLQRPDGRKIHFYSRHEREYQLLLGLDKPQQSNAHLRWHPLRREWVAYTSSRQGRTFLPSQASCPLCPMASADSKPTDIPVADFEVAIFDNRFAAFIAEVETPAGEAPAYPSQAATGNCEVVCYSSAHQQTLAQLETDRRRLVCAAIADRCNKLYQLDGVELVVPFENVGKEIGVTLEHPHAQIYALPMVPPNMERQAQSLCQGELSTMLSQLAPELLLRQGQHHSLLVPWCARYPYEMWLVPHRACDHPGQLTAAETDEFADLLGLALGKLQRLFSSQAYTMAWYCAPKANMGDFHFYLAIQPLRRAADKLKYLAGIEQSTGLFLADVLPEQAANTLRAH